MTLVVILNTPHDTISQRMAQHARQVWLSQGRNRRNGQNYGKAVEFGFPCHQIM